MFDWKIMAASFAALLVVSSVLVGGFGFTDILDTFKDFLGDVPFEGLVTSPLGGGASKSAMVSFRADSLSLDLERAEFTADSTSFTDFSGNLQANLTNDVVSLSQIDTDLKISIPLTEVIIQEASLDSLSLADTSFTVSSDSLETSGSNTSLDITGFSGQIKVTSDIVELSGNFSSVRGAGKAIV